MRSRPTLSWPRTVRWSNACGQRKLVEVLPMRERTRDLRKDRVRPVGLPLTAPLDTAAYALRLARRLRAINPDLVHANTLKAGIYGSLAARLAGVPVIWHVRDRIAPDYLHAPAVWPMRALIATIPDGVIANSEATHATLWRHRGGETRIVYSPVSAPAAPPEPALAPLPQRNFTVGMVGRIARWKGQHVFLEAFARAFPSGNETAVLVGEALFGEADAAYGRELRELVRRLDIVDRVEFRGFRDDVWAELARMDLLVHGSITPEPFGQVIVEAMLAGIPVIASAGGGPSEILTDRDSGLLYPPGNVDALAQALRRLRNDTPQRIRLRDKARTRAERFAPEAQASKVMELYRSVIATYAAHRDQTRSRRRAMLPRTTRRGDHRAERGGANLTAPPLLGGDHYPLRIFIDGAIVKPQLGGIATYIGGLTAALAHQPGVEVCIATSYADGLALPAAVEVIDLPASVRRFERRIAWRERNLEALASTWNADIVISPTPEVPLRGLKLPVIVVVHDIGPLQAPAIYGRARWARFSIGVPLALRRADHVVCVSSTTLLTIRQCIGSFSAPCSVIREAGRRLPERPRAIRSPPYILTVGSMLAHKNIQTLVRALNDERLSDVSLSLAGPLNDRERRRLAEWQSTVSDPDRIRHFGFVDVGSLADLYAGAAVVALPSLYEGFGLPLLEAMSAGVPVVASSISAHHEVGGEAALYVDQPLDAEAWARTLAKVVHDDGRSASLSRVGADHVRNVSWDVVGERMAGLAREVVAGSAGRRPGSRRQLTRASALRRR